MSDEAVVGLSPTLRNHADNVCPGVDDINMFISTRLYSRYKTCMTDQHGLLLSVYPGTGALS